MSEWELPPKVGSKRWAEIRKKDGKVDTLVETFMRDCYAEGYEAGVKAERVRCAGIARRIGARREEEHSADRSRALTADEIISAIEG